MATGFLTLCYTMSVIDRSMLAYVAQPLKRDLQLSDLQLGLVQGFAFSITYAIAGLPIGAAVDRYRRTLIVAMAVASWSLMTVLCGFATSFAWLFIARIGVGIGEAGLTPAAYSIMGDLFSRRRLSIAATVYSFGPTIAAASAAAVSGLLLSAARPDGMLALPLVGALPAWRIVMLAIGLPGFVLALIALMLREPVRQGAAVVAMHPGGILPFVTRHARLHIAFMMALMFAALDGYAATSWTPSVLERSYQWSAGQTGGVLSGIALLCGSLGIMIGGLLTNWCVSRGREEAITIVAALAMLIEALAGIMIITSRSGEQFLIASAIIGLITPMMFMLCPTFLQFVTPPALRGRVTALALLIGIGLGAGGGPSLVGAVNTAAFGDGNLPVALGVVLVIAGVLSSILFVSCIAPVRRYLDAVASA